MSFDCNELLMKRNDNIDDFNYLVKTILKMVKAVIFIHDVKTAAVESLNCYVNRL